MKRKLKGANTTVENKVARTLVESADTTTINVDKKTSVYSWPYAIENFSKILNEPEKKLLSPLFGIGNYEFQLELSPRGPKKDTPESVSIYLKLIKPEKAVIEFTFSILDLDGVKKLSHPRLLSNEYDLGHVQKKLAYGVKNFLNSSTPLRDILVSTNDQLIILCEIFDLDATESMYEFHKIRSYKEYLDNAQFSDVKFIVGDKQVYAHKIILATANEIFGSMAKDDIINIENIEYEVFIELIRFIYTGQVHKIERLAKKLVIAANKYGIEQLKLRCQKYLCPLVTTSNVLESLKFADFYNLDELKKKAISYFVTNRKVVMKTDHFKNEIELLRPGLTADLMMGFTSI